MSPTSIDLVEGYYVVPAGKLANAVVWLEMRSPPPVSAVRPLLLEPVGDADGRACRDLFMTIGTPWLWSSACEVPAGETSQEGPGPTGDFYFALHEGRRIGLVGFDGRGTREVEITWFGLVPEATGHGLGRRMMAAALDLAWTGGPERVWLHTCNFDHPAAMRFYQACGFLPFATGFEIMSDPRLTGGLPRTAAPHVPLIALDR